MTDIDYEAVRPGDIVRLENSDSDWRVYEPVERRETAIHSGLLIGMGIKGSPGLGGWKPARKIVEHIPRGADVEEPEDPTQATFEEVGARV